MSFPFSEHPDDSDRPISIEAWDIAPYSTIEVEAIHGLGKVMLSFIGPGSSYAVSLGLDTLTALIASLTDQLATASEFFVPLGAAAHAGYSDTMPVFSGGVPPISGEAEKTNPVGANVVCRHELPLNSEPVYRAGATPWTPRPCADPPKMPHKGRVA